MSAQLVSRSSDAMTRSVEARVSVAASGLGKLFDVRPVLRDVSFVIPASASVALFGPNGAGKTTLLRVLATLAKPTAGHVEVEELDVMADAQDVRRIVGYVGHQPHLYDELTAQENLMFFARMYGLRDGAARGAKLLDWIGLSSKANERVRTLSRGQSQRLALARGVIHEPRVLLLDEPDTGLDDDANALLRQLIAERSASGLTTLFTTHHLEQGLALSERALVLVGGRIVYAGASSELSVLAVHDLYHQSRRRAR